VNAALIDYGAGNLVSVAKALACAGFDVVRPRTEVDLAKADAVVVPGVGHFAATVPLQGSWQLAVLDHVRRGRALLGICLGLQWLFEGSEEAPDVPGLGLLTGTCFRLPGGVKVPHVGWNTVEAVRDSRLLDGVAGRHVYFTHSFAAPVTAACAAVTTHGVPFASVIEHENVFGVQWHPENSGAAGLRMLRNFASAVRAC
jgi:imidazole glycerol phosphate synthase glutamine amidotransferase subunit